MEFNFSSCSSAVNFVEESSLTDLFFICSVCNASCSTLSQSVCTFWAPKPFLTGFRLDEDFFPITVDLYSLNLAPESIELRLTLGPSVDDLIFGDFLSDKNTSPLCRFECDKAAFDASSKKSFVDSSSMESCLIDSDFEVGISIVSP